jgi:hypothetical protein
VKAKLLRTVSETKEMKFLDMTSPVARNDPAGSSGLATIMPYRKKARTLRFSPSARVAIG